MHSSFELKPTLFRCFISAAWSVWALSFDVLRCSVVYCVSGAPISADIIARTSTDTVLLCGRLASTVMPPSGKRYARYSGYLGFSRRHQNGIQTSV